MSRRSRIGWYVHHHGGGHRARFLSVRPHVDADVVVFSSLPVPAELPPDTEWVVLPTDDAIEHDVDGRATVDPVANDPTAGGALHWAPQHHNGHRSRLREIALRLGRTRAPDLSAFVVDVSAEVAAFVRLLGVPVALFTQPGERTDAPHSLAFSLADLILAPWPGELMLPAHLEPYSRKVLYTGGITRFDGRRSLDRGSRSGVVLLGGRGGSDLDEKTFDDVRAATPDIHWSVLGALDAPAPVDGATTTWVDDPWSQLSTAEVVVSWAGQNAIADLAAADARAVVIPQRRPFGEQAATARALGHAGLAVVETTWPRAADWPRLVERARSAAPEWARWRTVGAAGRAGDAIGALAARGPVPGARR